MPRYLTLPSSDNTLLLGLGGCASPEMVERYAHLATEHLSRWLIVQTGWGRLQRDKIPTVKKNATR